MRQHLSNSIEFSRSREGLFLVLVAALLVQAPHSAEVFHRISTSPWFVPISFAHAAGYAVVLELAVLLFVVRGRTGLSWGFASISVLMNIFYYYTDAWWTLSSFPLVVQCIVTSVALPLAIAFYSHEVASEHAVADAAPVEQKRRPAATKTVRHTEHTEQLEVFAPEQPTEQYAIVEAEPANSLADAPTEQKRRYLAELLSAGQPLNKTELARQMGVGRTTLHTWVRQIEEAT